MPARAPPRAARLSPLCLLALLALLPGETAAQRPRPRLLHRRGTLRGQTPPVRRRLVQEFETSPCEWCHGRTDGTHSDNLADPPGSGFFTCRGGQLVQLDACPSGLCFDEAAESCVKQCAAEGAAGVGGGTAGAFQGELPKAGYGKGLRGPRARDGVPDSLGRGRTLVQRPRAQDAEGILAAKMWRQANALLAFKAANGDPLGALRTWVVPRRIVKGAQAFYCKGWKGVTCGNGTDDVVALQVSPGQAGKAEQPLFGDPSLMQSIPPEFGRLTALTTLDLSYLGAFQGLTMGGLVGSIPSELGRCTKLETLSLQFNALSGSLPGSLSKLQRLTSLQLGYNQFDAPFPTVLTTLANLAYLNLFYVGFSGPIPRGISNLKSLTSLVLRVSPVSGRLPPTLGSLPSLQYLTISSNPYVHGSIPASLSRLTGLSSLRLTDMNLTGALPSAKWWRSLISLTYLQLDHTGISGTLPLSMPTTLQTLLIMSANLSGPLPESLALSLCNRSADASPVTQLNLGKNRLAGPLPMQLSFCSLGYLYLDNNLFEGRLPKQLLPNLAPTLQYLDLSANRLNGTLDRKLLELMAMASYVNISRNGFSGAVPKAMYAPTSLKVYDVSGNLFEGSVSDLLQLPGNLNTTLGLSDSRFTGRVPKTWLRGVAELYMDNNPGIVGPLPEPASCATLRILDTSRNSFGGEIPAGILRKCPLLTSWSSVESGLSGPIPSPSNKSRNLQQLLLSGNSLSGPLPSGFSHLRGLKTLDLSRNALEGPLPAWLTSFAGLLNLDVSHNAFTGGLPPELRVLAQLLNLSLSHNALSGSIPLELAPPNLATLRLMDLSSNQLNGTIPWGFSSAFSLDLNLSNNQLSGQVPGYDSGALNAEPSILSNNTGLCGAPGFPACPVPGLSTGALVGIIVGSLAGALLLGGVLGYFLWRRLAFANDPWNGVLMVFREFDPPLTTKTLLDVTDTFSDEYLLGRGGFGSVYKATLPDGTVVAVKRLQEGSSQGNEEFQAEVEFLGTVKHRNLVSLLAAYVALPPHNERLLAYEFLPGGSLDQCITEKMDEDSPYRSFNVRRNIITDIARGLKYLHHDCDPGIIHRDMKPANVLMDDDLVAHVADFGLAHVVTFQEGKDHMTVEGVLGTPGYIAPEYVGMGHMGFKSDVYAYGVTVIQIMTGRRTTDEDIVETGLQRWASAGGGEILDPQLSFDKKEEQEMAVAAIKLGVLCTARVPCDRPSMEEVVRLLESLEQFAEASEKK